jgi:hypothetical protein
MSGTSTQVVIINGKNLSFNTSKYYNSVKNTKIGENNGLQISETKD